MERRSGTPYGESGKPRWDKHRSRGGGRGGRGRGPRGARNERSGGINTPAPSFEGRNPPGRNRVPTRYAENQSKPRNRGNVRPLIKKREGASPMRQRLANRVPHGFIFGCTNSTEVECLDLNLFGLPANNLSEVEKVSPGTALFLFNYDERMLTGVFAAACQGAANLIPHAWGGNFPAQVRVVPPTFKRRIPESRFKIVLKDNYFSGNKFMYHLEKEQVDNLCDLFDQSVPQVGHSRPPRYVLPYNRAVIMKRTVAKPNVGGKLFGGLRGVTITRDSVKAPPSERGKQQFVLGGGNARSSGQSSGQQSGTGRRNAWSSGQISGQQSGNAMDTSDFSVGAPQGMEATSTPTPAGFAPAQSSPHRFTPNVTNAHNINGTPGGRGPLTGGFGGAHPVLGTDDDRAWAGHDDGAWVSNDDGAWVGDDGAWAADDGAWAADDGAWATDSKMKTPVRFGEDKKMKNLVRFGSDDRVTSEGGGTMMDFQSGGIGAGPSHLPMSDQLQDPTTPTHQPPAVDTASFGQHDVQFGRGGSPSTPPRKPKGKFDWSRLTSSSGAPFGDTITQGNAQPHQAGFGGGVDESMVTTSTGVGMDVGVPAGRENDDISPHSPSQSNRDPRLGFQNQKSVVPPQFSAEGLGGTSSKSRLLGQSQQQVVFEAQAQEGVTFGGQMEGVEFGVGPQQNAEFGTQPQQEGSKFSRPLQLQQGNATFGDGVLKGASREKEAPGGLPSATPALGVPTEASQPNKEGGIVNAGGAKLKGAHFDLGKPKQSGTKRSATDVFFETDEPYEYIKGLPIVTAAHIMKRGIGNHSKLYTERGVGGIVCVPGMGIPRKIDLPRKKKAKVELSERSQHFIKVAQGSYSGGSTPEEKFKNMIHGRLSLSWRTSCAKAWDTMKNLRKLAITTNRLHLFDEVLEESGYIRCHGIIPVQEGKVPLF